MRYLTLAFIIFAFASEIKSQCTCDSKQTASVANLLISELKEVKLKVVDEKGKEVETENLVMGDMLVEKNKPIKMNCPVAPNSFPVFYWERDPNDPTVYAQQPYTCDYWLPWKDGIVPYIFGAGVSDDRKEQIKKAIKELNRRTHICITPRTDEDNFIIFNITSNPNEGGSSRVGRRLIAGQSVNISVESFSSPHIHGVIQHEICHAIGLFHTQMLPSRDNSLLIKWDNIKPDYKFAFFMIHPLPPNYPDKYGRASIMHYSKCAYSADKISCTMECLDPVTRLKVNCPGEMGQRNYLSSEDTQIINSIYPEEHSCEKKIILFLFDVSGSMNEGSKFEYAKKAARHNIEEIEQFGKKAGITPEVGIMVFSGECGATAHFIPGGHFSDDLLKMKENIERIPFPNGGTPLPDAIKEAEKQLQAKLEELELECGILVILSDGESTCGPIRPDDAYGFQFKNWSEKKVCSLNANGKPSIAYYTVGLNLQVGSVAERDLQYLSSISGGKYFIAQDQQQLSRAFQKISQVFVPIAEPQGRDLSVEETDPFFAGTTFIYIEEYDTALVLLKKFVAVHPTDSAGLYNIALMFEANERFKSAAKHYELYLQQSPKDPNHQQLREKIFLLQKDYQVFLAYNKRLIQNDLAYLNLHFERLQATPDAVPLAGEFAAFIREKYFFYNQLPDILEMDESWLKKYSKEISQYLKEANFYLQKKPEAWGDEGIYRIGLVHEPMRRLVKQLGN